jgi:hypothetical protein
LTLHYGHRYTEAFLSQVARADGADRFTDALACWITHLWYRWEKQEKPNIPVRSPVMWTDIASLPGYVFRRKLKERKAEIDAELEPLRCKEWQAYEQCNAEFRKQERYCQEQREVLRSLEDLKEQERSMYELDNRKDQVMTVCKVAVANLAMWVRDQYFPPAYVQATWKRLLPFFQLPGNVTQDSTIVQVELCPFNDHALN